MKRALRTRKLCVLKVILFGHIFGYISSKLQNNANLANFRLVVIPEFGANEVPLCWPIDALCVRPTKLDKARIFLCVCAARRALLSSATKVLFLFVVDRRVFVIFIF